MKKQGKAIVNLIFVLIIGNLLLFMLAKSTYNLANGLEPGTPEYESAKSTMYFWFDFSNHLRYVFYNSIIIAVLFIIKIPVHIRALMIIYLAISIKACVLFAINGNTGTFLEDIIIFVVGILWLLKKKLTDWDIESCAIKHYDKEAIYRVTNRSKTFYGTILSIFGNDVESVKYYAYDRLYKFSVHTDTFISIECRPEMITGNAKRIPCQSRTFAKCLDKKINSKYHILNNNCENVTNKAKSKVGLKRKWFPQIN